METVSLTWTFGLGWVGSVGQATEVQELNSLAETKYKKEKESSEKKLKLGSQFSHLWGGFRMWRTRHDKRVRSVERGKGDTWRGVSYDVITLPQKQRQTKLSLSLVWVASKSMTSLFSTCDINPPIFSCSRLLYEFSFLTMINELYIVIFFNFNNRHRITLDRILNILFLMLSHLALTSFALLEQN